MRNKHDGTTRYERENLDRRRRARAHLENLRDQRGGRLRTAPLALAVSVLLGALFAQALVPAEVPLDFIAVRGAHQLAPEQVAASTGLSRSATWIDVNVDRVVDALEDHDWIARADAARLPNGTLLVGIEERSAQAWIHPTSDSEAYVVDTTGTPFAPARDAERESLPELVAAGSVTPREESERLAEAVRLARALPRRGLAAPERIWIAADDDPEGFALALPSLSTRFVLGREALDARIDELVRLVAARAELIIGASHVDLRFAQQAVLRDEPAREGSEITASTRGRAATLQPGPPG